MGACGSQLDPDEHNHLIINDAEPLKMAMNECRVAIVNAASRYQPGVPAAVNMANPRN